MSSPAAEAWRSHAFGLEIEGDFPAPGLPPGAPADALPHTRLHVVDPAQIDAGWNAAGATRVMEERFGGPHPERTIDLHPQLGYRLYARHFGLARISADGAAVRCAPPDVAPWRWQRFLVGRVLPWASVLRGREVLHAAAVSLGGRAVAVIGPTGAGKSSLALRLVLGGARFVTDDVLAVDLEGGGVRAHPGAAILSLRSAERAGLTPDERRRLGKFLGHSEKTYVSVARVDRAVPLSAIYFLTAGEAHAAAIEPVTPDARSLLSSTFVLGVQSPRRLVNQLEVCARIAGSVPAFRAAVAPGRDATALAREIERHAAGIPEPA
jgi:hypothetical protein